MKLRKYAHGITLMELMIVVVIIGILAAISFPNYRDFVARAKRNEAKAALLQIATNQEKFYLQNNTFSTDLTDLGFATDPFTTDSQSYVITVVAPTPNANYTATATYGLGGEEAGKCATFAINATGAKTSTPLTDCWTRTR
jgi:type IV pilus assembly protein PilE